MRQYHHHHHHHSSRGSSRRNTLPIYSLRFWREIRGIMEGLRSGLLIGLYMLPYKMEEQKPISLSFFPPSFVLVF
jgi:hypothetical protein